MLSKRLIDSTLKVVLLLSLEKIKESLIISYTVSIQLKLIGRFTHTNDIIPIIKNQINKKRAVKIEIDHPLGQRQQIQSEVLQIQLVTLYNNLMNKYHKNKITKVPTKSISALHHDLFGKLEEIQHDNSTNVHSGDQLFAEFQQFSTPSSHQILSKAKQITYSNKGKIERMRNQIKKMQETESADFMTGVGLYVQEQEPVMHDIDQDALMRNIRDTKYDDLAQLRRMIKKTQSNLREYSQSVYNTQNEIVNMADKYGREIDVGLAIKINRCGLDRTHYKPTKPKLESPMVDSIKRRTMSSYNARRNRL